MKKLVTLKNCVKFNGVNHNFLADLGEISQSDSWRDNMYTKVLPKSIPEQWSFSEFTYIFYANGQFGS